MIADLSVLSESAREAVEGLMSFTGSRVEISHALVISADGLVVTAVGIDERAYADRLAGVVATARSVADGGSQALGRGGFHRVLVDMSNGYLIVSAVAGDYDLCAVVDSDCDLGAVGYEMAITVERLGKVLNPDISAELKAGLPR
ncbi:MAG: roadblock/LC7 domain-containing protein [Nocardioides sp.]